MTGEADRTGPVPTLPRQRTISKTARLVDLLECTGALMLWRVLLRNTLEHQLSII